MVLPIPRRSLFVILVGIVAVVVIAAVVLGFGFIQGPANNDCPPGQCGTQTPPIYFTIRIIGTVQNPNFGPPYATVDTISASVTGGPPGLLFAVPRLDFWNNNYVLNIDYCLSYPNGQAYCTPRSQTPPPGITGFVGGGGSAGYQFNLYETGPHGTYSISVTVHYQATGCAILTCVKMDAQKSASFTI